MYFKQDSTSGKGVSISEETCKGSYNLSCMCLDFYTFFYMMKMKISENKTK